MCYMDLTRHTMEADVLTDVCNVCVIDMVPPYIAAR
jgi:hypothetical protein